MILDFEQARKTAMEFFKKNSGFECILADQDDPKLEKPFVLMKVISGPIKIGEDERRESDDDPTKFWIVGQRRFLANFQVYAKTLEESQTENLPGAQQIASRVLDVMEDPEIVQALFEQGLSINDYSSIQNTTHLMDVKFEDRASIDITFGYAMQRTSDPGFIETVDFSGGVESVPIVGSVTKP